MRDLKVTVLFSDDEYNDFKHACESAGLKQSTHLRQLAMGWAGRRSSTNDRRGRVHVERGVSPKKLPIFVPPRVSGCFHVRL